jgi:hypothetical protein
MSYNPVYLRQIIATATNLIGMYTPVAAELLLLTAAHESKLGKYKKQLGGGPALGIYQMEPSTLFDIYDNYLEYRPELLESVEEITSIGSPNTTALENDPIYATIMARLHYRRIDEDLPQPGDLNGIAKYAKDHWNTPKGKATVEKYINDYRQLVLK